MSRTRRTKGARRLTLLTPARAGAIALVVAAAWVGSSFARELYLSYRLNAQVNELRHENDLVAQSNAEYQQQLSGLSRAGGAEEQARLHDYVKPDEKVFIVTLPSPSPSPTPPRAAPAARTSSSPGGGLLGGLWRFLTGS